MLAFAEFAKRALADLSLRIKRGMINKRKLNKKAEIQKSTKAKRLKTKASQLIRGFLNE